VDCIRQPQKGRGSQCCPDCGGIGTRLLEARIIKGLGRDLLEECIERSRRVDGLEQLILAVGAENTAASKLYRDAGFEVYGRDPDSLKVDGRDSDVFPPSPTLQGQAASFTATTGQILAASESIFLAMTIYRVPE
jgi:hypothetical protein